MHERTCKHLQNWLGEEYEMYRIGKMTGGASDETITRAPRHKNVGSLMLAHKWTEDVDPKGSQFRITKSDICYYTLCLIYFQLFIK